MAYAGKLYVFEGIDGTGKSTHCKRIAEQYGLKYFREPGSVEAAENIRSVVLSTDMSKASQALLFIAARIEFVEKLLIPTLKAGQSVILDRYYFSTLAYQNGALPWPVVTELHKKMPRPDKVILLECDPEVALARSQEENVMEREGIEFFRELVRIYRRVVTGHNTSIISANSDIETVYKDIMRALASENPSLFS